MNQALKPAKGKLLPLGIFQILANRKKITWLRQPVLGVLEPYRNRGIDIALYVTSIDEGVLSGYKDAELSWILESNTVMNKILDHLEFERYKTYRIYDRSLV
jgi:hypothetical protein